MNSRQGKQLPGVEGQKKQGAKITKNTVQFCYIYYIQALIILMIKIRQLYCYTLIVIFFTFIMSMLFPF